MRVELDQLEVNTDRSSEIGGCRSATALVLILRTRGLSEEQIAEVLNVGENGEARLGVRQIVVDAGAKPVAGPRYFPA